MREGTDCTVVGIAGGKIHALHAAETLEKEGISVEVIDPRTLVPLDKEIILNSVEKTGRLVVVDPAHKVCSAASEIISIVSEQGFWNLQAPPAKVAAEQVQPSAQARRRRGRAIGKTGSNRVRHLQPRACLSHASCRAGADGSLR